VYRGTVYTAVMYCLLVCRQLYLPRGLVRSGWRSKTCALQVRIFFEDGSSLQLFSPATGGNQVPVFSSDG